LNLPNKIEKLPDGNLNVELETGEKFTGDPLAVTEQLAKSQQETKKWAQGIKAENETLKAHPATPPPPPADANEKQLQEYLLNQTAKALGYNSGEEYKADLSKVKGTVQKVASSDALQSFFTSHPEFPGTPEANDMIGKIFDEKGWTEMTADNLHFAHLEAVDRHRRDPKQGYEPLSSEAINSAWANNMSAANRQNVPPMLRTGNPEGTQTGNDPYAMKMDDLRKAAIQQELSRR
jgi:hypothetical protein